MDREKRILYFVTEYAIRDGFTIIERSTSFGGGRDSGLRRLCLASAVIQDI